LETAHKRKARPALDGSTGARWPQLFASACGGPLQLTRRDCHQFSGSGDLLSSFGNDVTSSYGTVSGGSNNTVVMLGGTVSGGFNNTARVLAPTRS